MLIPLITTALVQAGIRLLNKLIERSMELSEATDSAKFTIMELWMRSALDPEVLQLAINEAQERFSRIADDFAGSHQRWLELFAELLEYAGPELESFTENIWLAYLFQSLNYAGQGKEIRSKIYIALGENYEIQNMNAKAAQHYYTALNLNPDSKEASAALKRLKPISQNN